MLEEQPTTLSSILKEYKSLYKEDSDFSDLEDFIEYVTSKIVKEENAEDLISIDHRTLYIECSAPNFNQFLRRRLVDSASILEVLSLMKRVNKLGAFLSNFPAQNCSREHVIACCSRIGDAVYNLYPEGARFLSKNERIELKYIRIFIVKLLSYFGKDIPLEHVLPKVIQDMDIF